jgi:anthranilate phosphoribosyltransferase
MARIYNYLLQQTSTAFTIIHGLDGYDEISLTNDTKVITAEGEQLYSPVELGKRLVLAEDLTGGETPEEAAAIFLNIIQGKGTFAQNAVVLANAAMALFGTKQFSSYQDAYAAAVESFDSGKAYGVFKELMEMQ